MQRIWIEGPRVLPMTRKLIEQRLGHLDQLEHPLCFGIFPNVAFATFSTVTVFLSTIELLGDLNTDDLITITWMDRMPPFEPADLGPSFVSRELTPFSPGASFVSRELTPFSRSPSPSLALALAPSPSLSSLDLSPLECFSLETVLWPPQILRQDDYVIESVTNEDAPTSELTIAEPVIAIEDVNPVALHGIIRHMIVGLAVLAGIGVMLVRKVKHDQELEAVGAALVMAAIKFGNIQKGWW
ncbi:hypothetical protein BS47DRAFT_1433311 [Hydnum rufescens UP504]|uniref:Uncharacterized protein n=1 Tax=Hydnum rufescens UP504 TaxID=1448309 RepID=A0A9P6DJI4_9AGAM|nr:hypothetical protein BS47DRAFT_1433311 [Hydnum rufescens UP504]